MLHSFELLCLCNYSLHIDGYFAIHNRSEKRAGEEMLSGVKFLAKDHIKKVSNSLILLFMFMCCNFMNVVG